MGTSPYLSMGMIPNCLGDAPCAINPGMTPAEILAQRVARRIADLGLNDNSVSQAVAGHGYVVRDIRRGSIPGGERLQKLADELKTTTAWLLGTEGTDDDPTAPAASVRSPARAFTPLDLPKNVPVYTGALGTAYDFSNGQPVESQVMDLGEAVDMVRRPPGVADAKGIYALYIIGDSQSPRFESGELIFVHPHRPVLVGDDVVVQIGDDTGSVGFALVKRLVRRTAESVRLRQFNPGIEFDVPQRRIVAIHKVLANADLWGF